MALNLTRMPRRARNVCHDQFAKVSLDLKVPAKEMRGDAFFVIGIDCNSPPGGQIYVDEILLQLLDL